MQIDSIDFQILQLLNKNSRIQWKEIGKEIHMTGQAVGNRIQKMREKGIIQAYSIVIDEMKVGISFTAFIIFFMDANKHNGLLKFIQLTNEISEAHRVSGNACYLIKVNVRSQENLNKLLDNLLSYGNYHLYLSIEKVKTNYNLSLINDN